MDDVRDIVKFFAPIVLVVILLMLVIFGCVIGGMVAFNKSECDRYARLSPDHQWNFSFYGGCLVKTESGRWVSPDQFFQLEQVQP